MQKIFKELSNEQKHIPSQYYKWLVFEKNIKLNKLLASLIKGERKK